MYKKYYLLLMFSGASLHAMQWTEEAAAQELKKMSAEQVRASMNERNAHGHTPLHLTILHPDERDRLYPQFASLLSANDRILANYDARGAHLAAICIKTGARVDIKDKAGRAAWWMAKKHKAIFPHIYAVIMAGRIAQDWNPPVPAPKNGECYTLEELLALRDHTASQTYLANWVDAQKTLDGYAEKK